MNVKSKIFTQNHVRIRSIFIVQSETYEQTSEEVGGLFEPFEDEPLGLNTTGVVVNLFVV